ncbi:hypothetical protein [Loktanella sp. Alg231-35]|uniref:hypothetical protein n=1 Tax=Loktanella sp. Alg231-35 TaxID=1922220 RepID=UPI000D54B1F3|nr:hypothetical protein [Loktanella sp. Alg231-35]
MTDLPLIPIIALVAFFAFFRFMRNRAADVDEDIPRKTRKRRGPDMAFSAGRDAAHQNTRLQKVFVPMEPHEEAVVRAFYLDELGLMEMRAPNYPKDTDGFWAVSGTWQIYFGTRPSFPFDVDALPSFPIRGLKDVALRLDAAGYQVAWDRRVSYVQRLIVVDPAGTEIALIGG